MYDLIGIGALNIDHIATRERLLNLEPSLVSEIAKFEFGGEKSVDKEEIDQILSEMGQPTFKTCLGGSAFNVIQTLVSMNLRLKLGYVGVAGETGIRGMDFSSWFGQSGVDSQFVLKTKDISGICVSFIHDRDRGRSLLTFPGANVRMADFLKDKHDQIVDYLTQARFIHVTSFYDDETPKVLSWTLRVVKEREERVRVSFDPGPLWATSRDRQLQQKVRQILSITDFLLLNETEFEELGRYHTGAQDQDVAARIFDLCGTNTLQIVLKRYDEIKVFFKVRNKTQFRTFKPSVAMPTVVEDSTGAGDVFAAGFLASAILPGLGVSDGAELGSRLLQAKLSVAGNGQARMYSAIVSDLLDDLQAGSS
jgi:sugar/nucleoside kinase (ribokinase family)